MSTAMASCKKGAWAFATTHDTVAEPLSSVAVGDIHKTLLDVVVVYWLGILFGQ